MEHTSNPRKTLRIVLTTIAIFALSALMIALWVFTSDGNSLVRADEPEQSELTPTTDEYFTFTKTDNGAAYSISAKDVFDLPNDIMRNA